MPWGGVGWGVWGGGQFQKRKQAIDELAVGICIMATAMSFQFRSLVLNLHMCVCAPVWGEQLNTMVECKRAHTWSEEQ